MKYILLISLTILCSCSTNLTYDTEKNCSPNALKQLSTQSSASDSETINQLRNQFANVLTPEFRQCYQSYLNDSARGNEYAICTVTTVEQGKVTFVDADDRVNLLNSELKSCLENKISKADWSFLKAKKRVVIQQPIIGHLK